MIVKNKLWHGVNGCDLLQLRSAEGTLKLFPPGTLDSAFQGLSHRSNLIDIPADTRYPTRPDVPPPQESCFNWMAWVKGIAVLPVGYNGRIAICILHPNDRRLEICSELRTVRQGSFMVRFTAEKRRLFLLGEEKVVLRPLYIFGGLGEKDVPAPDDIALY